MVGENFPEGFPHSSSFLNCFLFWPFYLKKKYKNCHLTAGVAMYEWKTLWKELLRALFSCLAFLFYILLFI